MQSTLLGTPQRAAFPVAIGGRIPSLDGWRGVAILLVLISHAQLALNPHPRLTTLGQDGVTIFFVLSGFLITTLLARERERYGTISLRRFYLRRFFRLMPCAWCYLLAVVILGHFNHRLFAWREILGSLFFFRNYVDLQTLHPITSHFWSLSIEEQFYLIWPAILLLLGERRSRWFALTAALLLAAWRFDRWRDLSSLPFHYTVATQFRAEALFLGCFVALMLPTIKPYLRAWQIAPLLVAFILSVARHGNLVPLYESVIIALLLAVTTQYPGATLARVLEWSPIAFLGTISYSIYVWQQLFMLTVHKDLSLALALPVVILASYYLIEKPFIALGTLKGRHHLVAYSIDTYHTRR